MCIRDRYAAVSLQLNAGSQGELSGLLGVRRKVSRGHRRGRDLVCGVKTLVVQPRAEPGPGQLERLAGSVAEVLSNREGVEACHDVGVLLHRTGEKESEGRGGCVIRCAGRSRIRRSRTRRSRTRRSSIGHSARALAVCGERVGQGLLGRRRLCLLYTSRCV